MARRYADILVSVGVERGLIGPRESPRIWDRHVLNSAVLVAEVPDGASVLDIGSGAGLPGLVVAIARPDLRVTLAEPLLRRSTFLHEVADELGLGNVEIRRARAEDLHGEADLRPGFDVVTSRAVAPLDRLVDWSMPLVAPDGAFLALKGERATSEVAEGGGWVRRWDVTPAEVVDLGVGVLEVPTKAVRMRWREPVSVTWPPRPRPARTIPRGRKGRR